MHAIANVTRVEKPAHHQCSPRTFLMVQFRSPQGEPARRARKLDRHIGVQGDPAVPQLVAGETMSEKDDAEMMAGHESPPFD